MLDTILGLRFQVSGLRDEQIAGTISVPAGFRGAQKTALLLAALRLFLRPGH